MSKSLVLSVHQLVDFLLRSGDIDSRIFNRSSMKEGSRIHSRYQESQSKGYISEYPLKTDMVVDDVEITLQGRADGIITLQKAQLHQIGTNTEVKKLTGNVFDFLMEEEERLETKSLQYSEEQVTIDEIKGTYRELDKIKAPEPVHLAQAKVYA